MLTETRDRTAPDVEPVHERAGLNAGSADKAVHKARKPRRALVVGLIVLAVAGGGVAFILAPASSQRTDNAYVGADATAVAPKVRGLVAQVLVSDNQVVRAGDPLVRIDAEEFDARVATATAELADAQASVATAKAALVSLDAEEQLSQANIRAAESAIRSAKAQADKAVADRKRYDNLVATGAVATRDADHVRAAAITAEQDVARVTAMVDVSKESAAVTRAKRASLEAALQKSEAAVARSRAALELARQDQRHATVLAPIDGIVANRQAQQGDYVQPGARLLMLVPMRERYVTANFKETQVERMAVGQKATVEIDAVPGHAFSGTVESLAPGSASRFALLPFEPGTGNFTKVVQRVPVRIRFDPSQSGLEQLKPGLSATVKVSLKG